MPYKVTISFDDLEHLTPRANAESAYFHLLMELFHGSCKFEVQDVETGKIEIIELEQSFENDSTVARHLALTTIAAQFLSDEQKSELETWEKENLDGSNVGTSDWEGWEKIYWTKETKEISQKCWAGTINLKKINSLC